MALTNKNPVYDVIIIGAGPAGSSAAMVLARSRRTVLMIDEGKPRNARSHGMHNYLSRDGALPLDFLAKAHEELDGYHVKHIRTRAVEAKRLAMVGFEITDADGSRHICRRLLIATGVCDNIPEVPGMKELWGCGVYHCPFCDGFELCDKTIGLYSRNFNGFGEALALRHLTDKVILFTDGARYLRTAQRAQLSGRGIRVIDARLRALSTTGNKLTCVAMQDGSSIPCDAVFINHGQRVNNELLLQLGARCTLKGAAVTNRRQECSIPGLYVAGDAAIDMHFVIVAAAEGAKAGVAIHDDLLRTDNNLKK